MAETLGTLCDKLTIVKLKQWHSEEEEKQKSLAQQEQQLTTEINDFIVSAISGAVPVEKLTFSSNKVYKTTGNEINDITGDIGSLFAKLAHTNCELWHEQEKVYAFESVPVNEKDDVVKRLAILNLERNRCMDEIDQQFKRQILAAPMPKRYLIVHLNSNGDLLCATAIARQLKEVDDPGCHITWAVATPFKNILLHNPYIDELWEIPAENYLDIKERVFWQVEAEVQKRMAKQEWDELICPQLLYENMWRYDGTIRRAVLRAYRGVINDVTPVVRLTDAEIAAVQTFSKAHTLEKYKHVVLFECSPLSGQSSVTPQLAVEIAAQLLADFPETAFILSSNKKITHADPRIIDGSQLTFRENAELTRYCTHLIGCSSGITWLATSNWAKPLPMLQLSSTGINPIGRDFEREGLDTSQLVEMYRFTADMVIRCMKLILQDRLLQAKAKYDQAVPPAAFFVEGILLYLVNHGHISKAVRFIYQNLKQSNYHLSLIWMMLRLPVSIPITIWRKKKEKT